MVRTKVLPSYAMRIIGEFQPLRDADGIVYEWVPCMSQPHAWDEDALIGVRRNAALVCKTQCPALADCNQRRLQLGDKAKGVWAGVDNGQHHRSRPEAILAPTPETRPIRVNRSRRQPTVTAELPDSVTIVDSALGGRV
jgi:hypothetical protein